MEDVRRFPPSANRRLEDIAQIALLGGENPAEAAKLIQQTTNKVGREHLSVLEAARRVSMTQARILETMIDHRDLLTDRRRSVPCFGFQQVTLELWASPRP